MIQLPHAGFVAIRLSLVAGATLWCQPALAQSRSKPTATRPAPTNQRPINSNSATARPQPTAAPTPAGNPTPPAGAKAVSTNGAAAQGKIRLQHRLQSGEVIRTRTTHVANTVTRIQGTEDVSESRTVSDKVWEVQSVSPEGFMTFQYRIEAVNMSQKGGNKPEVTYDSRTDQDPPPVFAHVAKTITEPVATVTMDPSGSVIERDNQSKAPPLGMGEIAVPLPKEPIALGESWSIPRDTRVKLDNGTHKTMKLREQYTLEKVSAGVATIRVETQPLTPVTDPAVEAQLMQQMSRGVIKFDLDRGRLISKELSWDDEVVGFRGAETSLHYTGRFTEEPMDTPTQAASKSTPPAPLPR